MNIQKTGLAALIAAAGFTSFVPSMVLAEGVRKIDVTVDLAAIENAQAAAYWGALEVDLEAAIAARVADQLSEEGADLNIDITEVELSNGLQEDLGIADTKLAANVVQTHPTDNSLFKNYELMVDVNAAKAYLPAGVDVVVLKADTADFYKAMVETFADAVAARVKE
ncbi:hypothetical protein [Neogemmobacter tilapiae]|uniref:Uncharacterized protein n=1 Tax=Neogemmobacter tilapiae TaxID=875041 RepID=A0A918TPZ8_9RHOB|nr:hypothetical protein [Gemmobacter tilapiae]GHC54713.1 hypothetical protein GCM10007315_17110 [Gemmobacter tilapiae]